MEGQAWRGGLERRGRGGEGGGERVQRGLAGALMGCRPIWGERGGRFRAVGVFTNMMMR